MKSDRLTILLVRHGMTKNNLEGRFCGITDYVLTEEGKEKLRAMVAAHPYPVPEVIYTSPATRCIETLQICFPGMDYEVVEDLHELDFGEFEEKTTDDLWAIQEYYQRWMKQDPTFAFPGGELIGRVGERAGTALREIARRSFEEGRSCIAVVTHSVVMGQFFRTIFRQMPDSPNARFVGNGMGLLLTVEAKDLEEERPFVCREILPKGAPLPDLTNNPYYKYKKT